MSLTIETSIRKILEDCANDEIALDVLAQWAFNPAGRKAGYGAEENYPTIVENLCSRFDISDLSATEYVGRLREYSTDCLLSGTDINQINQKILEELAGEAGKKWRNGILKRFAHASSNSKKLAFLIFYLLERGLDEKLLTNSPNILEAFHAAVFEKPFEAREFDKLVEIGLINRLILKGEDPSTRYIYSTNRIFPFSSTGLNADKLKIQRDSKKYISRLLAKKDYELVRQLDGVASETLGIKEFDRTPTFKIEKKVTGKYDSHVAISPFVLREIRDDIRAFKHARLEEYELRIDSALLKLISQSWRDGKLDLVYLANGHALWRVDNQIDPKLYVCLAPWITESDYALLLSKLEVPQASKVLVVVLNQSLESFRTCLKEEPKLGQLSLLYPFNHKEFKLEMMAGDVDAFSKHVLKVVSDALDLSVSLSELSKVGKRSASGDVSRTDVFGEKPERPKVVLGLQNGSPVHWSPMRERNWNFATLGDAGCGKTETIKNIISQIRASGIPYLVLDSFSEYVSTGGTQEFGDVVSASEIAVNPFELGEQSPNEQGYRILDTIDAIFGLNAQQSHLTKMAIRMCYERNGILDDDPKTWVRTPPTLPDLKADLESSEHKELRELAQKIGSALGIQLYARSKTMIPFDKLVSGPMIVNLGSLQTNEMKSLASEFILGKVPSVVEKNLEEPQLFIIVDSAPNLFRKGSNSLRLLIEAKSRGLGIIYTYRDPIRLPTIAFNCTATLMSFKQSDSKALKITLEKLSADEKSLKISDKFSAAVKFSSLTEPIQFTTSSLSHK